MVESHDDATGDAARLRPVPSTDDPAAHLAEMVGDVVVVVVEGRSGDAPSTLLVGLPDEVVGGQPPESDEPRRTGR